MRPFNIAYKIATAAILNIAFIAPSIAQNAAQISATSFDTATKANSLDEAIQAALANEPQLSAKNAMIGMAQAQLNYAKANNKSQIGVNGTYGYSYSNFGPNYGNDFDGIFPRSLAIAWEKRLYDGGKALAQIDEADFKLAAENGEYKNSRNQLIVDVVSAYSNSAIAYQSYIFAKDNYNAVQRFAHDAELMFKAGEIPISEKAGADARLAQSDAQLSGAQAQLKIANANLLRLTNRVFDKPEFINKGPQLPASEAHAKEYAIVNHPLLAAGKARIEAAKAGLKAARANYKPQISAQIRGATIRDQFMPNYRQDEVGAYLSLNVPLWSGGRISSGIEQANYGLEAATKTQSATERAIYMAITQAYAAYDAALAQQKAANIGLNARQIAMKSIEAEMRVGERPIADVLEAQKNLTEAKLEVARANAALLVAKYQIVTAMGGDLL